jgi:hypothetical protein
MEKRQRKNMKLRNKNEYNDNLDDDEEEDEASRRDKNRKGYGLLFIFFVVMIFFVAVLNKARKELNSSLKETRYYKNKLLITL